MPLSLLLPRLLLPRKIALLGDYCHIICFAVCFYAASFITPRGAIALLPPSTAPRHCFHYRGDSAERRLHFAIYAIRFALHCLRVTSHAIDAIFTASSMPSSYCRMPRHCRLTRHIGATPITTGCLHYHFIENSRRQATPRRHAFAI